MAKKKTLRQVKKRKSTITKGVSRKIPKPRALPPAIAAHVKEKTAKSGRKRERILTVDTSGASLYYRKCLKSVLGLASEGVKGIKGGKYRLQGPVIPLFKECLRETVAASWPTETETASDFVAHALRRAAAQFPEIDNPSSSVDPQLFQFVRKGIVAEAWKQLHGKTVPPVESITLNEEDGSLKRVPGLDLTNPLGIECEFDDNKGEIPRLTIRVTGPSVVHLMNASNEGNPLPETKLDTTQSIWKGIARETGKLLGVFQPTAGRPASSLKARAAYLKDHLGLTYGQVARRLCDRPHQHNLDCAERMRKNRNNFYMLPQRKG